MHAVVADVTINDADRATTSLKEEIVPATSQAPGFVAGYWLDGGTAVVVFESEDAARAMAEQVQSPPTGEVTVNSVDVREVVAHA